MHETQKQLAQKYITDVTRLLEPGTSRETPYGSVTHSKGQVSSIFINSPRGTIDFSQDAEGEPMVGAITTLREPDHTDERDDPYYETTVFPQNEGDLEFMQGVVDSLRDDRADRAA